MLLAKTKLNTVKFFISKTFNDSHINHDNFMILFQWIICWEIITRWKKKSKILKINFVKTMEMYYASCKKILQTKKILLQKLNKTD